MKRRWIRVLLCLAFMGSTAFTVRYFDAAWPAVTLDMRMEGDQARRSALALAQRLRCGPAGASAVASFDTEDEQIAFAEMEGSGRAALARLARDPLYTPYNWVVRLFRPGDPNEATFFFTPSGEPCGFREDVSEDVPGPSLSPADARRIAEHGLRTDWPFALDRYRLVETSREVVASGRTDHTFTYETSGPPLGTARYRLDAVVSGDRLTTACPYLDLPEAFSRRYAQMRSANDTIAGVATVILALGLFGLGVLGSLGYLVRRRAVQWRPAMALAIALSMLLALASLSRLPLSWFSYDTATSESVFLNRRLVGILAGMLGSTLLFGLVLMAAEGLSRRAFPHFVQLWRVWERPVAGSTALAGQVAVGILLAAYTLASDTAVYLFAHRWLAWWSPPDHRVDPNVVATPAAWLPPFANALQAGVIEECLFRAIPLAAAALIGRRIGRPRLAIGTTLVLQAILFGAAHANYPQQPAYARIVEISPVFFLYGLVYLRFGLLPVILAHCSVDMVLMSLPLFFTHTPGIWAARLPALALLCAPVLGVGMALLRNRGLVPLAAGYLNGSWAPADPAPDAVQGAPDPASKSGTFRPVRTLACPPWLLPVAGLVGLALCLSGVRSTRSQPRLRLTRAEAIAASRLALSQNGTALDGSWTATARAFDGRPTRATRYVWQSFGPDDTRRLQAAGYLPQPGWRVRFVRFDPRISVAERAERYNVTLGTGGEVLHVGHRLPEARKGAQLSQKDARQVALRFLRTLPDIPAGTAKEISSEGTRRPDRMDWQFTFALNDLRPFANDELRLGVVIAGDRVEGYGRYVHVPEKFVRSDAARIAARRLVDSLVLMAFLGLVVVSTLATVAVANRGGTRVHLARPAFVGIASCALIAAANEWPTHVARFDTAQPFTHQALQTAVVAVAIAVAVGAAAALLYGVAGMAVRLRPGGRQDLVTGVAGALFFAGVHSAADRVLHWGQPPTALSLDPAGTFVPALAAALNTSVSAALGVCAMAIALPVLGVGFSQDGKRWWLKWIGLFCLGWLACRCSDAGSIGRWMAAGGVYGVGLVAWVALFVRRARVGVRALVATALTLSALATGVANPYPGAVAASALSIAVAWGAAWLCGRWLMARPGKPEEAAEADAGLCGEAPTETAGQAR